MATAQTCHICREQVDESDYRRELACSHSACPANGHAYHEPCIGIYLRKLKTHRLDRGILLGYPCPVILDAGRPCGGNIVGTHQKQPLNQKRKQKRVEAAATAAAPKPKPAPAAVKAKDPRPAGAAATLPPRALGAPALPLHNVAPSPPSINFGNVAPAAKPDGAAVGLTVRRNEATAPDPVVRQRVIPGWAGPGEGRAAKAGNALEQQRALVAALKAEAKAAAGRGSARAAAAPAAAGGVRGAAAATGGGGGDRAAVARGAGAHGTDVNGWRGEDSPPLPVARTDAVSADWRSSPGAQDVYMASDDLPAWNCPMPAPFDDPAPRTAAAEQEGAAEAEAEADPVVAHVPVYATEDGTVVVTDEQGNYVRMEDVYGAAPELTGFMDEQGGLAYYVVIRASQLAAREAQLAQLEAEQQQQQAAGAGAGAAAAAEVARLQGSGPGSSGGSPGSAPRRADGLRLPDQGFAVDGAGEWHEPHPTPTLKELLEAAEQVQQQQPSGGGGADGKDLDDLLALCGGGGGAAAPVPGGGGALQRAGLGAASVPSSSATVAATVVAASSGGSAVVQQQQQSEEGEDLDDLLQLLCV